MATTRRPPVDGTDGLTAYEIAHVLGFEGDELEWIASLRGQDGKDGADGLSIEGPQGPEGASGIQGARGEMGPQGPVGQDGPEGERGPRGAQGGTGPQGPRGQQGPEGATPDHKWDGTSLSFERPDGSWGEPQDLQGPRGPRGPAGGGGGGGGSTAPPFDLDSLGLAEPLVTPDETIVKQNGVWLRMRWDDFINLIGAPPPTGQRYADDYADHYTVYE